MKKTLSLLSAFLGMTLLSGCSLAPASPNAGTGNTTPKTTVSKSVWKSTDGGRTWEAKNSVEGRPQTTDWDVLKIAVNPNDSNNIYVGLKSGGMLVSTDGGETWKPTIFVSEKVYGMELPSDGSTIYASAVYNGRGKIFKSSDKGENWEEIYTAASDGPLIVSMKLDKNDASTLYAATSDNLLLKTKDGGATWKNIFKGESPIIQIETDKNDSNSVYILDDSGNIARSKNAGEKFAKITPRNSGSGWTAVSSSGKFGVIRLDPGNKDGVYAAGGRGIFRSKNGGDAWERVVTLNDPESSPVSALAINPNDSKKIVYGSAQAAYESEDGGSTWTAFQFELNKGIGVIEYDQQNPSVVWAGFRK